MLDLGAAEFAHELVSNQGIIRIRDQTVEGPAKEFRMTLEPQCFKAHDAEDYMLARW